MMLTDSSCTLAAWLPSQCHKPGYSLSAICCQRLPEGSVKPEYIFQAGEKVKSFLADPSALVTAVP